MQQPLRGRNGQSILRTFGSSIPKSQSILLPGVLSAILLAILNGSGIARGADTSLVYVTPRGVTYTVTDKGLSTVHKGFGSVIDGSWSAYNAESRFQDGGTGEVRIPAPTEKTLTVLSPIEAEVRHVAGDSLCLYRYTFDNDDVLISCRFENRHATATIQTIGFSGLGIHFARVPEGILPVESAEFLKEQGIGILHPSSFSPVGGSYGVDKNMGISASPSNGRPVKTLLLWDYADWNAREQDRVLERQLNYIVHAPVPPGGSATFGLTIRVSPELNWQFLLEPYQKEFQQIYGKVQYKADGRWIATDNLAGTEEEGASRESSQRSSRIGNRSRSSSSSGRRSLDRSQAAQEFCDTLIPRLSESNGQGVVLKGYGVTEREENAGTAEFNLLPPDVDDHWNNVVEQFAAARLKFGVASSPVDVSIRTSWTDRQAVRLNPRDSLHRELIWQRYDQMIQRGCKLFFFEQFGGSLDDVELMRWLRDKMGPEIETYVDQPCDAILVYSGGLTGAVLKTGSSAGLERGYQLQYGEKVWEICQWLAPGAQMAGRLIEVQGNLNDALETPERYFYSRHLVPLLPVDEFKRAPAIKKVQPLYVEENGTWLPSKMN